jgi:hypothetical protein
MKLKVKQAGADGQLTVGSQKEFLQLFNRGVIAGDDLVLRGASWVPAAQLPWIHGMAVENKRDNKRLLWITVAMMVLGLAGVVYIETHAAQVAKRTGALVPGAVHAIAR